MSHFLLYAARLQDAGITELRVRLDTAPDRERIMHVEAPGHPTRTFTTDGTDRMLESLEDGMAYAKGGPTKEMLQAAIEKHPAAREDLCEWFADALLMVPITDEDLAEVELDEAAVARTAQYAKGLMRGIDIVRTQEARVREGSNPKGEAACG
jgi:hypothetical protein